MSHGMTGQDRRWRRLRAGLCAAVAIGAVSTAGSALAQGIDPARCAGMSRAGVEVYAYEVQRGDGCARIAERLFGNRRRWDIIHAFNPDMGPTPHRLRPGTHLCLPREAPPRGFELPPAHVTALRQHVRARPPDRPSWAPARLGQPVERGARVDVRERAFAELTFHDTSTVTLRGDTLVIVYGDASATRASSTARLERGSLRTRLGELRGRVETDSAIVELAGGAAVTSVDAQATTRLSNHEGRRASVTDPSGAGAVPVPPGFGSAVRRGRTPSPARPLPPAPAWDSVARVFLGVPAMTTVRGAWRAVPDARVYRVELSRRRDGRELVAAVEVPASVTRFELHRLPPGTYYARVSTIDGDFFESRPSDAWTFELRLAALEAPWEEPSAATFDPGDASEEPRPLALWPGTRLRPPEGIDCGGDPILNDPGALDVPCVDEAGRPVGLFAGVVRDPTLTMSSASERTVPAGATVRRVLRVAGAEDLPPGAEVTANGGFEIVSFTRRADGFEIELRAPTEEVAGELHLTVGAATLARAVVRSTRDRVASERPSASADRSGSRRDPLRAEALGLALTPSVLGLRARPDGVGGWLGVTVQGDADGADRVRGVAGLRAGLGERAVSLELATAYDFHGAFDRQAVRGSGDLWASVGGMARLGPVELAGEVGAWLPTQRGSGGLRVVRLSPSLHLAIPLAPVLIRSRQGLFVDLDRSGNLAWASAYGVDVDVVGPLTLGAELDLTLGQEDRALLALALVGGHVSLRSEHFVFSLAARGGLPRDGADVAGTWSLIVSATVGGFRLEGEEAR